MAEVGDFDEKTPLFDYKNDDDDENSAGGNTTTGFDVPQSSSTPRHCTTTMNAPSEAHSWFKDVSNRPYFSTSLTAEAEINKEFPFADKNKIKYMMDDKGRVKVGLIEPKKPYYILLTKVPGKDADYQINKSIPKEVLRALGKSRREEIENEIKEISADIDFNKNFVEKTSILTEKKRAQERIQMKLAKRADLIKELEQLKKGEYTRQGGGQTISLEVFQQHENNRQERERELQQERQEQEIILNDENTPIVQRELSEERVIEIDQEVNAIENERKTEVEKLSLRDRIREKVKAIFKKYGVTVTAIFLAAGVTIGAVISTITNALKSMGQQMANGLKMVGAKAASALPGLIGTIVSFLFKTAGQAIGFLAEHTWLLILAVVVFIFNVNAMLKSVKRRLPPRQLLPRFC